MKLSDVEGMGTSRGIAVVVHTELRVLRTEPTAVVVMTILPLLLIAFMRPLYESQIEALGFEGSGALLAVPGFAVTFALYLSGHIGFILFREWSWRTWDLLRCSALSERQIILGKLLVPLGLSFVQVSAIIFGGLAVFGSADVVRDSFGPLVLVGATPSLVAVCLSFLLFALIRSLLAYNAVAGLVSMTFGAIGGAFGGTDALPSWAALVAKGLPTYWLMSAFEKVTLEQAGVGSVARTASVALLFAGAFLAAGWWLFSSSADRAAY